MTTYRLVTERAAAVRPVLDEQQQAVVDHPGGPLLVLAGPGTGKTTTLVEAIAARIEAGADPSSVLALTFSRKAAEQLRDRVTARVGRTTGAALCQTFHSFAYGLIRAVQPDRALRRPDAAAVGPRGRRRAARAAHRVAGVGAVAGVAPAGARHPRLRARGAGRAEPGPREAARRRTSCARSARSTGCPSSSRRASSWTSTSRSSTTSVRPTTPT